ncbi:hypothetical protein [Paenibacillus sp. YN15]|uniref:hypothetical protein n=1 Tax=Paenibacillus sp. YN15 TaxID=1742774 RepID=UPI000DCD46C3|nr:hypothetical protein [Paenibacillus sp. YN15]RAV04555.1 hypothetical protein DQG13_04880 [Paenibacillus sp. YN15]
MQQNQSTLTQDRNLIGEKELLYIKDYLSWELLAVKKCEDTANTMECPQLSQLVRDLGKKHQQHYNTILSQLQ